MKKNILIIGSVILSFICLAVFLLSQKTDRNEKSEDAITELRKSHEQFLANSPFKKTQLLSRAERKKLGIPPNAYYEQMWELTMDPSTGRPMPERLFAIRQQLQQDRQLGRGVSGTFSTPWVDRGPNDQGGRTRGIMFDPNDVNNSNPADDYTRVFAGGVSGGLWVNDNILNSSTSWTQLNLDANIAVNVIISDPNDSNVMYIGAGESYASGNIVGRGIWKSTDAGMTWQQIFGGYESFNTGGTVDGIFFVNDIVARNVSGTTELYIGVVGARYGDSSNPNNALGVDQAGVYKSVDGGQNWTRFDIRHSDNSFKSPCDLEIDINNNIWFTTTSDVSGNLGGDIYRSTDGNNFTLVRNIPGGRRTELEPSQTNANIFWVAAQVGTGADLFFTNNAFTTISNMPSEPNDADTGIPANDFTRGQAFYDLLIEADQNNVLYTGGIDLFRTEDFGINWRQISKWSNNNNLGSLQVPLMHADQHALVFRPGTNGNQAIMSNDGGVYFASNISSIVTSNSTSAIQARNRDYNTTQFYYGDINFVDVADGDDLVGGTQDNGTQMVFDAASGANAFIDPRSGDGGFTEISKNGDYIITSYPGRRHIFSDFPNINSNVYEITEDDGSGGDFINQAALDDNRHVLYVNSSTGATNRITRYININFPALFSATDLTNSLMNSRPSAFKVSPYPTNGVPPTGTATLLVGLRNGRLLKLTNADNAPVWTNIGSVSFVGSISDIEFGQNENEIFVTMHNYGVTSVWRTLNGGTTWNNKEGNLPDVPVKCILQNPLIPNEVIIGTDLGIWATGDISSSNPNWVQVYTGMSDPIVVDLDLRPSDNTILATTFGRGLFTGEFNDMPLDIEDNVSTQNVIKVFPTVSNGKINISSTSSLGMTDVAIYNLKGQRVHDLKMNLDTRNLPLQLDLSSGNYFVKFTKGSFTETQRIIIK